MYVSAIGVLNAHSLATNGTLYGFLPFEAFMPEFFVTTIILWLLIIAGVLFSVSSYFFEREKGFGVTTEKKDKGYSRWASKKEMQKGLYEIDPKAEKIDHAGLVVINDGKKLWVDDGEAHNLVIGGTGSGKTQGTVFPMIKVLAKKGESMVMTDPKGELYNLHSKYLKERGYEVKVIDLRDTYSSDRWNPLEGVWDNYQKYLNAHKLAYAHIDDVRKYNLQVVGDLEDFDQSDKWYEFDGKAFWIYEQLVESIKVYKKRIYDEIYEDLNDLCSILIPIENEKDPMWEKGARSITLAVLLAMLEDSENPELGMTKEKYNFFNMTKILQNSTKDYADLRNYFAGRSRLSKSVALSKQVCDAATQTRASYMSIVYEKLSMFNDAGICALTSSSDFNSEMIALKPTALFLKIPDEKDTRHNLAAIFILNIYKTLIKIASAKESLSLDRNVYFIMDEFGNMPKIEKFDKFITVGRSRKIWFTMIIQSYAQLNNVYGDTVADIVKGNCGIKMFIGSNDMETCKEYSELCGNITVVTSSVSYNGSVESSKSTQTQVRPLIYPSELQRLNHPGDIGHSIIVTFGNYPLKTYFSPSFKVKLYKNGKIDNVNLLEHYFDESKIFYNIKKRNELFEKELQKAKEDKQANKVDEKTEEKSSPMADLQKAYEEFFKENPDATLEDFYRYMATERRTDINEEN